GSFKQSGSPLEEDDFLEEPKLVSNSAQQQKPFFPQSANGNLGGSNPASANQPANNGMGKQPGVAPSGSQQKPFSPQSANGNLGGSNPASANQALMDSLAKQLGAVPSNSQQGPSQAGAASSGGFFRQPGSPTKEDELLEEPKLVSNSVQQKPFSPQPTNNNPASPNPTSAKQALMDSIAKQLGAMSNNQGPTLAEQQKIYEEFMSQQALEGNGPMDPNKQYPQSEGMPNNLGAGPQQPNPNGDFAIKFIPDDPNAQVVSSNDPSQQQQAGPAMPDPTNDKIKEHFTAEQAPADKKPTGILGMFKGVLKSKTKTLLISCGAIIALAIIIGVVVNLKSCNVNIVDDNSKIANDHANITKSTNTALTNVSIPLYLINNQESFNTQLSYKDIIFFKSEIIEIKIGKITEKRIDNFLYDCRELKVIEFTNSSAVYEIGDNFLNRCESLESIDFSTFQHVNKIGSYFLYFCTELKGIIDLKNLNNVISIENQFMRNCYNITGVNFSTMTNLTQIGNYFMGDCWSVHTLNMSTLRKLFTIGDNFLYHCRDLNTLTLAQLVTDTPSPIGKVGVGFLYNCYAVENFYSTNYKADWFETGSSEPSFAIADIDPSHNPFAYTNGLTISGDESNAIRNKFPNSSIKPYRNLL
ncbi:MAG: hypothetical protein LBV22_01295, partial [Mycoplasmataceae bacterium]|nr:hypothetical protein [Mycoplasmataceae bacterium]